MRHANLLPDETRKVLDRLVRRSDIAGFTLIGGTAIALRHGHRTSEDIDLAWTGSDLPTKTIRDIVAELPIGGPAHNMITPLQRDLAEDEGFYLAGQQQDWKIDGVKLTFYAQPPRNAAIIDGGRADVIGNLRHADDDTLFRLKCVVLLDRTASRDLFDLWWFVSKQGRTVDDILATMREHDPHLSTDMHLQKLAPNRLRLNDPGFDTDLADAPRTKEELLERMSALVDEHRRELARRATLAHVMRTRGDRGR